MFGAVCFRSVVAALVANVVGRHFRCQPHNFSGNRGIKLTEIIIQECQQAGSRVCPSSRQLPQVSDEARPLFVFLDVGFQILMKHIVKRCMRHPNPAQLPAITMLRNEIECVDRVFRGFGIFRIQANDGGGVFT